MFTFSFFLAFIKVQYFQSFMAVPFLFPLHFLLLPVSLLPNRMKLKKKKTKIRHIIHRDFWRNESISCHEEMFKWKKTKPKSRFILKKRVSMWMCAVCMCKVYMYIGIYTYSVWDIGLCCSFDMLRLTFHVCFIRSWVIT